MSHDARNPVFRRSDLVRQKSVCSVTVKKARRLKFWIYLDLSSRVIVLYILYLCMENKDAGQLSSYCNKEMFEDLVVSFAQYTISLSYIVMALIFSFKHFAMKLC